MVSGLRLTQVLLPLSILSTTMALPTMTSVGCFSSSTGLTEYGTYGYQSSGNCQKDCVADGNQAVLGLTNGNDCWCGSEMPPNSTQVDDSKCNSYCLGYNKENCGGNGYWTVWLTGTTSNVQNAADSSASSSTSSSAATTSTAAAATASSATATTTQPSVVTSIAPGKTVVVTESASAAQQTAATSSATTQKDKSSGSSNVTPIVVGVVVGVVAVAAIAGALFFFLRHRRRKAAEGEYRQTQAQDFLAGGKPMIPAVKRNPQTPNSSDPEAMAQRRMSDGSIADNEDYSRRILKVTNPDDR